MDGLDKAAIAQRLEELVKKGASMPRYADAPSAALPTTAFPLLTPCLVCADRQRASDAREGQAN